MQFDEVLRRRAMVRAFDSESIDAEVLARVLASATRAPSAGHSQAVDLLALVGVAETQRYWGITLEPERRATFAWPGLLAAPVLIVVCVDPSIYVDRYGEADKARTGLGAGVDAWPVPYWFVDAGMAIENILLAAVSAQLGACFFGVFDHEDAVRAAFGIPSQVRTVGVVALGHPEAAPQPPGRSARRTRREPGDVVHRGRW